MNSLERVVATITGGLRDRPPVLPVMLMQGAKLLNIPLTDYQKDGQLIAKGQLTLLEKFGHDGVFGFPHIVQDVTPWGAGLVHFHEGPPSVSKMAIHHFSDIDTIHAPDPSTSPQLKETLKAITILKKEVGSNYPVIGAAIAPFSLPSMLMGTEKFMGLLLDDPAITQKYFARLMEETTKYVVEWCNMQAEAGADTIVLADGIASNAVIRRDQFQTFALPYVKKAISQIRIPVVYELVGGAVDRLDLIGETGACATVLDFTDDLSKAAAIVKNQKLALMGNLNNIASLKWSPLKMKIDVRNLLYQMEDHPFIASFQGPEVPYHMPFELIQEMIDTVKKYGAYSEVNIAPKGR